MIVLLFIIALGWAVWYDRHRQQKPPPRRGTVWTFTFTKRTMPPVTVEAPTFEDAIMKLIKMKVDYKSIRSWTPEV